MGKILKFNGITDLPVCAKEFLKNVSKIDFQKVLVIGLTEDDEFWFGGSFFEADTIVYFLERAKKEALEDV